MAATRGNEGEMEPIALGASRNHLPFLNISLIDTIPQGTGILVLMSCSWGAAQ